MGGDDDVELIDELDRTRHRRDIFAVRGVGGAARRRGVTATRVRFRRGAPHVPVATCRFVRSYLRN